MSNDLVFVSDEGLDVIQNVDNIMDEHKPLILQYIIIQLAKKNPYNKMGLISKDQKNIDPNEFKDFSPNEVKVDFEGIESNYDFDKELCKKNVFYLKDKKLISEFIIKGDKKYSSEIGMDIVEVLTSSAKKVNERFNKKEQEAIDDNNFLKQPNSGINQLSFNQMQKKKAPTKSFDAQGLTWAEVAQHRTVDDCWTVVDGKIFDVTNYIPFHPGGRKIMQGAGKDATDLFYKYHAWVNIDTILAKSYIGMVTGPKVF